MEVAAHLGIDPARYDTRGVRYADGDCELPINSLCRRPQTSLCMHRAVMGVGDASMSGSVAITYNGGPTVPFRMGMYSVLATFTSADANCTAARWEPARSRSFTALVMTPTILHSRGRSNIEVRKPTERRSGRVLRDLGLQPL